jgi:hypothetical protein
MSNQNNNPKDGWVTINMSPYNIDYSNLSYSFTYFSAINSGVDNSAILEYDKFDAEFDALEDQTSTAKELLNNIGIKC